MTEKTINAQNFLKLQKESSPCVIDLRTAAECQSESLHQTLNIPVQELTIETFDKATDELNPDEPIYLLCQSGKRAEIAVKKLKDSNKSLVIIEGGLNTLKAEGAEIVVGTTKAISLERQVRIAAGLIVMLGVIMSVFINEWYLLIPVFVGTGLVYAGISDNCGMALILARMPWNSQNH